MMQRVTDPTILAQLNVSDNGDMTGKRRVTDPSILSQLNGNSSSQSNQPPVNTYLDMAANNPITNFAIGMGAPTNQLLTQGYNKLYGYNLQSPKFASDNSLSSQTGNLAGNIGLMAATGGLGSAAMESVPMLSVASKYLPQVIQRIGGMTALGAIQDPNSSEGAKSGAEWQTGLEALPYAGKYARKVVNYLQPQKYLNSILDNMSGGLGFEQNGKMLASTINNAYNLAKERGQELYGRIFNDPTISSSDISHSRISPLIGTSKLSGYENLGNDVYQDFTGDTARAHKAFSQEPNLANAHELQKKLGSEVGYWQRQNFLGNSEAPEKLDLYANARDTLKNDIKSKLDKISPELSKQYDEASNFWKTNVVPFESDNALKRIAQGKENNPTSPSITEIFRNPNSTIQPVVDQIGEEGQNRILFNELGKSNKSRNVSKFLDSTQQLDEKGLGSYLEKNEALKKQLSSLKLRNNAREATEALAGLGVTGAIAPHMPFLGNALELSGAATPFILNKLGITLPKIPGTDLITQAVAKSYRPLAQAYVGQNVLNQGR